MKLILAEFNLPIKTGKLDINGHIYTEDCIVEALDKAIKRGLYVYPMMSSPSDSSAIGQVINKRIREDGQVSVIVDLKDESTKNWFKDNPNMLVDSVGLGTVDEDTKEVSLDKIEYMNVFNPDLDEFKEYL